MCYQTQCFLIKKHLIPSFIFNKWEIKNVFTIKGSLMLNIK